MAQDPLYQKGYAAGYWDGVKDHASGKVADGQSGDIGKIPIQAMGLSTRVSNCLLYRGYSHVEDLLELSSDEIMRMRNVGRKTASEIAQWLIEHEIYGSSWSVYV